MKSKSHMRWFGIVLLMLVVSQAGCFDSESKEQSPHPYDEKADAAKEIAAALAGLGKQQRLLLVFGANWCPDCRRVDASMSQPEIAGYLHEHFNIVKVDVGNFDKNMTLSEYYGLPTKKGIPAMALVDQNDSVSRVIFGRELAKQHKKGREAFYAWLKTL